MNKIAVLLLILVAWNVQAQAQESNVKYKINEVFLHHKNPKKNWVEIEVKIKGSKEKITPELYLSNDLRNAKMWKVIPKYKKSLVLKPKSAKYISVAAKGSMYPLPLNTKSFAENIDLNPGDTLYLFAGTNLIPLDYFIIRSSNKDSLKYCSFTRLPDREEIVTTKAVTKNNQNLTMETSYPKKATILGLAPGIGGGKFRSNDNPSRTTPGLSFNISLLRERSTALRYTKFQYGLDFTFINFGFHNDVTDTLTKFVNGVEQRTIRNIKTTGSKQNQRLSFPLLLNTRINNRFSLLTGISMNLTSSGNQNYRSTFYYYDGITGALLQTWEYIPDGPVEYQYFTAGYLFGIQYHWKEQHHFTLKYTKYNESFGADTATGKGNSNFGLFAGYQFHFLRGRKRIPCYQIQTRFFGSRNR